MRLIRSQFVNLYWITTASLFGLLLFVVAYLTPIDESLGPVQKVFYLHLPVAINAFGACMVVFVMSIAYLWNRQEKCDDLAEAAACVAVFLLTIVLLTGIIWGRSEWGVWWIWSPKLTFTLILWLLYLGYLLIRSRIKSTQRRAYISAVYGLVAFLDVPFVFLSVRLMPDIHPNSIELTPPMRQTLILGFVAFTYITIGLVVIRYHQLRQKTNATQQ